MVESVKKQLNFVIGCLLNSLQTKAASIEPCMLFMDQMVAEKFNGPITLDYLSKGVDYANFCVATKDLLNIRQGWPKYSDEVSVGMSAAFVLNNASILAKIPPSLVSVIQNSANAFSTELNAAINFSNNGSINMQQFNQYPNQMMPMQGGVQQFPAQGVQQFMAQPMQMMPGMQMQPQQFQQPMQQQINPQMLMQDPRVIMIMQQQPQLMTMMQTNPQGAMQYIMQMLQQMPAMQQPMQQMQNPYMNRAATVMPPMQQMPYQAPTTGFINNGNSFGQVSQSQVGTARASSFSKAPANVQPQQVQLPNNNNNGMIQNQPHAQQPQGNFNQQPTQPFQPQPTAIQPSVQQQVTGATINHGNKVPPNMTQGIQPITNANTVPSFAVQPISVEPLPNAHVIGTNYSDLTNAPVSVVSAVAQAYMTYDIHGRHISRIYNRDSEIVTVVQNNEGVVVEDCVEVAHVKYAEHESQRILPSRTKAEKHTTPSTEKMNQVLELAYNEVSYLKVLEKIQADLKEAGEEMIDVDVSRIITELGTQSVSLDKPIYAMNKTSIVPVINTILKKNMMPIELTSRSVSADVVLGGPLSAKPELVQAITKLNKTENLMDYVAMLTVINQLDIHNYQWSWIHDEVLKEINNFLEKYFGLAITIDSVLLDIDELINYVGDEYGVDVSAQLYTNLHLMLVSTVLQLFTHDDWPDIVDENQVLIGKVYRVVTLPILSCQVPYNAPGKSGIVDRNTHTQLVTLLDRMMKWREDYHSMLLITLDNDIIEVNTTTIDGNYIMYYGNE